MSDEFGSRGELNRLPLLNHDNDRPTKVEDKTLADVIVESFDSLTETFDAFAKNIKPLTKQDVYDASKSAIKDSGLVGGIGGGRGNITIHEGQGADVPEMREYWKAKTKREEASLKRQEEAIINDEKKRREKEYEARMSNYYKWMKEASTQPMAFVQDVAVKKIFEPLIYALGGGNKKKEQEDKEEKAKQQKKEQQEQQDRAERVNKVSLKDTLTESNKQLLDGYNTIMQDNLNLFGQGMLEGMARIFSGGRGGFGGGGIGSNPNRIGNIGIGYDSSTATNIDAQDDANDIQQEADDVSSVVNDPKNTPLGDFLQEIIEGNENDSDDKKKEDKEKSKWASILAKPEVLGALKLGAIVAGIITLERAILAIATHLDDIKKAIPWLNKKKADVSTLIPVVATDSGDFGEGLVASGQAINEVIDAEQFDKIGTEAVGDLYSEKGSLKYEMGKTADGGFNRFLTSDLTEALNTMLSGDYSNAKDKKMLTEMKNIAQKRLNDLTSEDTILGEDGNIDGGRFDDVADTFLSKRGMQMFVNAYKKNNPHTSLSDSKIKELYKNAMEDATVWNGSAGGAIKYSEGSFESYGTKINPQYVSSWREDSEYWQNIAYNNFKEQGHSVQDWYDDEFAEVNDAYAPEGWRLERSRALRKDYDDRHTQAINDYKVMVFANKVNEDVSLH